VSAENDERSELPSTSKTTENVEEIRELIHENRRRTIHELADTLGISYGVGQFLTENLDMRRIAAKFVPRLLANDEKQRRVNTEFVTNNNMVVVPHPPYSPDLAPVISLCFPN
jgi:hypothetical protein